MFKEIPILMKVAALFTGGKDSMFAIYIAQQFGWDITHLITLHPEKSDSWMYHSLNIHLTEYLAEAIDIPLIKRKTNGEKEKELEDLKNILHPLPIDGVISGALASEYQRTRIEQICHQLHIRSFTPLWHKNQELLLRDQLKAGFEIIIVGVFAHGLDQSWLGASLNQESLNDFLQITRKYSINAAGEGGEYETLVVNGPLFTKQLILDKTSKTWKRDSGALTVEKAHLQTF